jgi:arginine:ornithine antiporter/lysine permease
MAGVLEAVVGPWGKVFVSIGLLISILGNYLSWSLLAAEVLRSAAETRTMPVVFARENASRVPSAALWLTNIVIQIFLMVSWFADYAFTLALKMTSSMTLIPYLLVAAYGLKLAWTGETYRTEGRERVVDWIRSAVATVYAAAMIFAGGKFLLLSALLYASGTVLYVVSRREQNKAIFTSAEGMIFGAILVAAVAGLYGLVSGSISV